MITKILVGFIAVVVIAGLMALAYEGQAGEIEIEEGAPELVASISLTKVETDESLDFVADIIDGESLGTVETDGDPPASIEVGVPFVEPESNYVLEFSVTVMMAAEHPDINSLNGDVKIIGHTAIGAMDDRLNEFPNGIGYYVAAGASGWNMDLTKSFFGYLPGEYIFDFAKDGILGDHFRELSQTDNEVSPIRSAIKGKYLHNSEFTITAFSESATNSMIWGQTSADIILKVGEGGAINLDITSVTSQTDFPP